MYMQHNLMRKIKLGINKTAGIFDIIGAIIDTDDIMNGGSGFGATSGLAVSSQCYQSLDWYDILWL